MLMFSWCNYMDVYILVKGTITLIGGGGGADLAVIKTDRNKKNCSQFTYHIAKINKIR